MADDAARILEGWRKQIPPTVPKRDVAKVVAANFPPESFKLYEDVGGIKATHKKRGGSHFLVIEDALLRLADEKGYALVPGGVLMIPHAGGKHVKRAYVKDLVDAIDLRRKLVEWLGERNG